MPRRAAPVTAAAVAGLLALAPGGPASAEVSPSAPSDPASSDRPAGADPELMAEVAEQLAEDRERIESAEITDEMRAAAVLDLRADASTFDLRADDATTSLETTRAQEADTVVTLTADLLFEFGSAELGPAAERAVAELAAGIPEGAAVAVDGHTDSVGTEDLNNQLSRDRAESVAAALRSARDDLELTVTGHGESRPVAENEVGGEDNPAGRALNRRVEVTYPTS